MATVTLAVTAKFLGGDTGRYRYVSNKGCITCHWATMMRRMRKRKRRIRKRRTDEQHD